MYAQCNYYDSFTNLQILYFTELVVYPFISNSVTVIRPSHACRAGMRKDLSNEGMPFCIHAYKLSCKVVRTESKLKYLDEFL
jgi:hypothetical protein